MRLPAEQRRRQLLDVARDMFAERGFHTTSMDDIASAAGVTKPVLYQHFDNKRALFLELLQDVEERLVLRLAVAVEAPTARERVTMGFHAYFSFVEENPSAFRLLFGASLRNDPEFQTIAGRVIDAAAEAVVTLIDLEVNAEHRATLAHALVGMAEGASRHALTREDGENSPSAEVLADWLSQLAWSGMRGVSRDGAASELAEPNALH